MDKLDRPDLITINDDDAGFYEAEINLRGTLPGHPNAMARGWGPTPEAALADAEHKLGLMALRLVLKDK